MCETGGCGLGFASARRKKKKKKNPKEIWGMENVCKCAVQYKCCLNRAVYVCPGSGIAAVRKKNGLTSNYTEPDKHIIYNLWELYMDPFAHKTCLLRCYDACSVFLCIYQYMCTQYARLHVLF